MPELELVEEKIQTGAQERFFQRFTRKQRYMHAVLFSTFLGLAGTGLPLRFSQSYWARWAAMWRPLGAGIATGHMMCCRQVIRAAR